ncbi:MAG: 5-bromo-4-chloroindolyl phosphate hydrolysis family protein, partial [Alphaproteobacteria bacterium]
DALGMLGEFGALTILLLSAWLLREGMKAEAEFEARKIARPPAIPRKAFAAVLSGIGVFTAAWLGWGQPMISAIIFGALASGAHVFAFGLDPMKKKGMSGRNAFDNERAAKAIEKAEVTLAELNAAAAHFGDRALEARIERLGASVREVFRAVEDDPRDLTRARKFLGVYLTGARDATVKFADLYSRNRSTEARDDYVALISDLETSFHTHREVLLLDDRQDLDIEIEVLRDRLQQEGLKTR